MWKLPGKDFFVWHILVKVFDTAAVCMNTDPENHENILYKIMQTAFFSKLLVSSRALMISQTASDAIVSILGATRSIWSPVKSGLPAGVSLSWKLLTSIVNPEGVRGFLDSQIFF